MSKEVTSIEEGRIRTHKAYGASLNNSSKQKFSEKLFRENNYSKPKNGESFSKILKVKLST